MSIINTGAYVSALRPGVNAFYGLGYNELPPQYEQIFDKYTSTMNWEIDVNVNGFESAGIKREGEAVKFISHNETWNQKYQHIAYGLGFILTHEQLADNLYPRLAEARSKELGRAMRETKERVTHAILNEAVNPAKVWADGLSLLNTGHLLSKGGTFSNMLAVAEDLSELALEQILIQIQGFTDDAGKRINMKGMKLIIPKELQFAACRILDSDLQNDTALNAVNAGKYMGILPNGSFVSQYLTDPDMWFVKTNCPEGLKFWQREAARIDVDVAEFDTDNVRAKAYERYSAGITDLRAIAGSEGAV